MDNENHTILKYYIYHYLDNTANIYRGLISYEKDMENLIKNGWEIQGEFYAINPYLKPIPTGMKVFSLEIKNYFPYDILSYKLLYDIYEVDDLKDQNHVNFITYNRPTLNSVPLYFYEINGNIYPTFDNKPPNSQYKLVDGVNPIFVIRNKNAKFYCDNGICFPGPITYNNVNPSIKLNDNLTFDECLKVCKNKGKNILHIIKDLSMENNPSKLHFISNIFYGNNKIFIFLTISTVILLILFLAYNRR